MIKVAAMLIHVGVPLLWGILLYYLFEYLRGRRGGGRHPREER